MSEISHIQLQASSVLNVPFHLYDKNFLFIVNGEEFKTSRIIADLISSKICQLHLCDPTIDEFVINTCKRGDFSLILNLANFEQAEISENEIPFFSEIIQFLDIKSLEVSHSNDIIPITLDNAFDLIKKHEQMGSTCALLLEKEIDFISSHFYEICGKKEDSLKQLSKEILIQVLSNPYLELIDEEQLLDFINHLYRKDSTYSIFYEFVDFSNVRSANVDEFLQLFDMNDLTNEIWNALSTRLKTPIYKVTKEGEQPTTLKRYKQGISFSFEEKNYFEGIFNYLRSKGNIEDEVIVSCSNKYCDTHGPDNAILFDQNKYFCSNGDSNSWISFDFKDHRVIPTYYSIKSGPYPPNTHHPKTWVIEGSNDNEHWNIINEQDCCSRLNGKNLVHAFMIKNPNSKRFKYLRMRQTGPNWANCNFLAIDSFEIFGTLI